MRPSNTQIRSIVLVVLLGVITSTIMFWKRGNDGGIPSENISESILTSIIGKVNRPLSPSPQEPYIKKEIREGTITSSSQLEGFPGTQPVFQLIGSQSGDFTLAQISYWYADDIPSMQRQVGDSPVSVNLIRFEGKTVVRGRVGSGYGGDYLAVIPEDQSKLPFSLGHDGVINNGDTTIRLSGVFSFDEIYPDLKEGATLTIEIDGITQVGMATEKASLKFAEKWKILNYVPKEKTI